MVLYINNLSISYSCQLPITNKKSSQTPSLRAYTRKKTSIKFGSASPLDKLQRSYYALAWLNERQDQPY